MPVTPFTRLGPYDVKSLLALGGMGEVYRGWDTRLKREVAIKVLPTAFSADADRLRRFEQEARAAAALNHPNIVAVFDVGSDAGVSYVVSELLEGQTLREAMGAGRLPVRKVLDYAIQIATGLAAAHEKRIVHRDIKPENLFITNDGRVKLLDFGIAKLREIKPDEAVETEATAGGPHATDGLLVGTAGYMAPEQVRGDPVDSRSDTFSFGATLYEMVSGVQPFKGNSPIETLHAILNDDPPVLPVDEHTAPGLARIIQHCLEKEPARRFQSARDLTFALKQLPGTVTSSAVAPSMFGRSRRPFGIAAAALLAAVALGMGYLWAKDTTVTAAPSFRQLTFRRGHIGKARFAPDGQTVISSAMWDGLPMITESTRIDTRAATLLLNDGELESVSRFGELAVLKGGTLAHVPIGQRGMREVVQGVRCADWAPDGTMAVIREDGPRQWVEYPPGRKVFEDPSNHHSCFRVSPDGQFIAMIQQERLEVAQEWLTIIDRRGRVISRSQRRKQIMQDGLAWTPDSREVWFGAAATDVPFESAIRAMTLTGAERVVHRTIKSIRIEDIAPDGRALVVGDSNRVDLRVLDTQTHVDRDLTWITLSEPRGLSSDGRHVIFSEVDTRTTAFIRPTDGGPAVPLGDGNPKALSPDGKWVVLSAPFDKKLKLVPTGAGEGRTLDAARLERWSQAPATWTPDGQRVILVGNEPGKQNQVFSLRVSDADLFPITPEGVPDQKLVVSPDSSMILAVDAKGTIGKYPLDGKASPVVLAGQVRGDLPLAWSTDNKSVWVLNRSQRPVRIFRIDLTRGQRSVWFDVPSSDAASTLGPPRVYLSADGRTLVYSYRTHLSDLYLAEGLK